jgi:hypothetical protein
MLAMILSCKLRQPVEFVEPLAAAFSGAKIGGTAGADLSA